MEWLLAFEIKVYARGISMPPITIFCPFTRPYLVKRWFDDLASTDLKPEDVNLVLLIDSGEDQFGEHIGKKIYSRIMDEMNRTTFRSFYIIKNFEHHVNEASISIRRKRIVEIHEQSKAAIANTDGEYVLGLEDDTVFTNLSVKRLYDPFVENEHAVGLVSGYEAGRWHNKIIGIWGFDNTLVPHSCWTELPDKGYQEIDAAGFYFYLTPKQLYLEHTYHTEDHQPWGPDVNYGLWLRNRGYRNYVDWSQPCNHQDGDIMITPDSQLYTECFWWDTSLKAWVRKKQEVI